MTPKTVHSSFVSAMFVERERPRTYGLQTRLGDTPYHGFVVKVLPFVTLVTLIRFFGRNVSLRQHRETSSINTNVSMNVV